MNGKRRGRSRQLLLGLFNSHLSGGCCAAPTGRAVYTILNPTAAPRCQVLCNTVPQLLEFYITHNWNRHMKILISETTVVHSCECSGGSPKKGSAWLWCKTRLKTSSSSEIHAKDSVLKKDKTSSSHHLQRTFNWYIKNIFWPWVWIWMI